MFICNKQEDIDETLETAFADDDAFSAAQLFYSRNFLMTTSRFVCGEISRSIKPLCATSRSNVRSREKRREWSHRGNTCRTRMNASSVLMSVTPPPLPPPSPSAHFIISRRLSHPFLPWRFCLINVNGGTKNDLEKKRKRRCRARIAREISDHICRD